MYYNNTQHPALTPHLHLPVWRMGCSLPGPSGLASLLTFKMRINIRQPSPAQPAQPSPASPANTLASCPPHHGNFISSPNAECDQLLHSYTCCSAWCWVVLTSATWWSGGQVVTPDLVPGVPTIHYLPTSEREDCSQLDNPGTRRGWMVGGSRQRREQSGVMRILTLVENTFHQAPAAPLHWQ